MDRATGGDAFSSSPDACVHIVYILTVRKETTEPTAFILFVGAKRSKCGTDKNCQQRERSFF